MAAASLYHMPSFHTRQWELNPVLLPVLGELGFDVAKWPLKNSFFFIVVNSLIHSKLQKKNKNKNQPRTVVHTVRREELLWQYATGADLWLTACSIMPCLHWGGSYWVYRLYEVCRIIWAGLAKPAAGGTRNPVTLQQGKFQIDVVRSVEAILNLHIFPAPGRRKKPKKTKRASQSCFQEHDSKPEPNPWKCQIYSLAPHSCHAMAVKWNHTPCTLQVLFTQNEDFQPKYLFAPVP